MSIICPVCIEPLVVTSECQVVSAPCGHVFHHACLSNWMTEKSSCPTCRNKFKESSIKKLYLEFGSLSNEHSDEVAPYVCQLESVSFELKMKKKDVEDYKQKALKDEELKKELRQEILKLESKVRRVKSDYADVFNALENMRTEMRKLRENLTQMDQIKNELNNYKKLDTILYGNLETADEVLKSSNMEPDNLVLLVSSFKSAYEDSKKSVMMKDKIISKLTTENIGLKSKYEDIQSQMSTLERVIDTYKKMTKFDSPSKSALKSKLETSFEDELSALDSQSLQSPTRSLASTSKTPDVRSPKLGNYKIPKFNLKRKSDTSPVLTKKIKVVSSRLKRPFNQS